MMRFAAILCLVAVVSASNVPERELAHHLLHAAKHQGIVGRPVAKAGDAVKVQLGLSLFKILSVDADNYVTVSAFYKLSWTDPVLAWDPKKFGEVQSVALPANRIWRPDVVPYNDFQLDTDDFKETLDATDAYVMADGSVFLIPRINLKFPCTEAAGGNLNCKFIAGSWVHDNSKMLVEFFENKADVDIEDMDKTAGIELVSHSANIKDKEFSCCPGIQYRMMNFEITVKKTGAGQCTKP